MFRRLFLATAAVFILATPLTPPTILAQSRNSAEQQKECTVYITRTGARYHKAGCRYLRYSQFAVTRSEALSRGYTPCKVCGGSECER